MSLSDVKRQLLFTIITTGDCVHSRNCYITVFSVNLICPLAGVFCERKIIPANFHSLSIPGGPIKTTELEIVQRHINYRQIAADLYIKEFGGDTLFDELL